MRHLFTLIFSISTVIISTDGLEQQLNEMLSQIRTVDVVVKEVVLTELN